MSEKKILLVDDESAFVHVFETRLKAAGFAVCSASDGEDALRKIKTEKPDLIVMDILMPKISGYAAAQKIRDNIETKRIPLIMTSGKAGMKEFCEGLSDVEFLAKPFEAETLIDRIEHHLKIHRERASRPKIVVLAGVEDLLVKKIRDLLESLRYKVRIALNEEDAFRAARADRPHFILCQFWEDSHILDPQKLAALISRDAVLMEVPLFVFCKESLSLDAAKSFKDDRLIVYRETSDLLRKMEPHLRNAGV